MTKAVLSRVKHKEWSTACCLKRYDLQFSSSFSAYVMQIQYIVCQIVLSKTLMVPRAITVSLPVGQPWVRRKYLMLLVCALRRARLRLDADATHTGHCLT
jgi:hypothetical protein